MKRRQHTENTRGKKDQRPVRRYPEDGIPIAGKPLLFRMRSGKAVYGVASTGAIVRVGHV